MLCINSCLYAYRVYMVLTLKTKTAEEVTKAYLDHIYSNFGGSVKIMMDNGTEFKNKEVVEKLGTEFSIHSPPYRPQSNGKIEGFHRFLKMCISKHINQRLNGMNSHCKVLLPISLVVHKCIAWHWGMLRECTLGSYRVLRSISINITKILACVVQVDAFIISL